MSPTDRMMAWAQIALSFAFIGGVFVITAIYELGYVHLNADQGRDFAKSLDWMQITCGAIVFFWFNRTRVGGIPDPTQMITQSHTSPDGTKTTVTSPVNAPPASVPVLKTSIASSGQADKTTSTTDASIPVAPKVQPESKI